MAVGDGLEGETTFFQGRDDGGFRVVGDEDEVTVVAGDEEDGTGLVSL